MQSILHVSQLLEELRSRGVLATIKDLDEWRIPPCRDDRALYAQVEQILLEYGTRAGSDATVQLVYQVGRNFTVFGDVGPEFEDDLRTEATAIHAGEHQPPEMAKLTLSVGGSHCSWRRCA